MGPKYRVETLKSWKTWRKQRHYWRVVSTSNGKILLTSEMYVSRTFVNEIAMKFANDLDANFVCKYKEK